MPMDLREQKFGIEIELTGLTRKRAAEVIGKYLGQEPHYDGGYYEEYSVRDGQGRKWKVMYDSSIVAVKRAAVLPVMSTRWNLYPPSVSMQISQRFRNWYGS